MKKIITALLAVVLLPLCAAADQYGLGIRLGAAQKDTNFNNLYRAIDARSYPSSVNTSKFLYGAEVFYEYALNNNSFIGLKIGVDSIKKDETYAEVVPGREFTFKIQSVTVPLSAYYKYNFSKYINAYGGAGLSLLFAKYDSTTPGAPSFDDSIKKNKAFLHLNAGVEWRVTDVLGWGIDGRYNFAPNIDFDSKVKREISTDTRLDLEGFSGAVQIRFYF
ncbi:opacity protein-like surface antigen [Elusimicrobium simillimum]|uniref:outer membrane beta-barrel protein n=1 Tax=Elusimicrobium simillimum TaxID=3143438 RepID=UPI003C6EB7DD